MKILNQKPFLQKIFVIVGVSLLFGLIYAQSPLYTSNQNQYFLHGLSAAGFGNLSADWLARTLDPTPIFSQLVNVTYRISPGEFLFYIYYIVLMGIYLFSLTGIAKILFDINGPVRMTLFLTLVVAVHSAAIRFFLSRGIGDEWTFIFEGGVAGQRVLGVVFQPSTFGVLLVLSIFLFLKEKIFPAVVASVAATYFHPTYLLSAGILVCAYIGTIFWVERNIRKAALVGISAFFLVLPVLFYVYGTFGIFNQNTEHAQAILVSYRIPHHAVISEWFDITTLVQLGMVSLSLWLVRKTRLFPVLLISTVIGLAITLLQVFTKNNSLALVFPWRISVILVPLGTVLILAYAVQELANRKSGFMDKNSKSILIACGLFLGLLALAGGIRFGIEYTEKKQVKEQSLYQFVRDNQLEGQAYLIPTKMQDFRLETGAPIYIDFKSIPYSDAEVLEWYRRIQFATKFYEGGEVDCKSVERLYQEGISRLILEVGDPHLKCNNIQEIYHDSYYRIFQLPAGPPD